MPKTGNSNQVVKAFNKGFVKYLNKNRKLNRNREHYVACYDFVGKDGPERRSKLREYLNGETWAEPEQDSVWIITKDKDEDIDGIHDLLRGFMSKKDKLLVCELTENHRIS